MKGLGQNNIPYIVFELQWNLVNSKSSGLGFYFELLVVRIIGR